MIRNVLEEDVYCSPGALQPKHIYSLHPLLSSGSRELGLLMSFIVAEARSEPAFTLISSPLVFLTKFFKAPCIYCCFLPYKAF